MRIQSLPAFVVFNCLLSLALHAGDWPAWRGPAGSGITPEKNLPTRWSATDNVRWKIALPDRGNSTPVVWGDRVFITQAVEKDHQRTLICLSRHNGKALWTNSVIYTAEEETHPDNPPCSASPVTDGQRIIVSHGSAGVFCYDLAGKLLWKRDLGQIHFEWGNASSPVLYGDICILYFGPGKGSFLTGLDKKSGETLWTFEEPAIDVGKRTDGFSGKEPGIICTFSTPIIVNNGQRDELIMSFPRFLRAFDPNRGKELWHCDGLNPLIYTSPIHGDGVVVAMGGFSGTTIAVKTGGSGDVTQSHRLWQNVRTRSGIGSGVIRDGHIYLLNNGGIAECIDLKSGKTVWLERPKAIGPNADSWSSMVLSGDNLYILNKSGDCIVLKASPKFEVIATNSIGNELTNASLVPSDGDVFIRTHKHLWCITEGQKTAAAK
jgi:outer membrane protein assembly factor BamB